MAKKNITIDQLAVMVQKGFDAVDKRFDGVATKEQVEKVDSRLQTVEETVGKIDNRLKGVEKKLENIEV